MYSFYVVKNYNKQNIHIPLTLFSITTLVLLRFHWCSSNINLRYYPHNLRLFIA